jgi:hypothetical protein
VRYAKGRKDSAAMTTGLFSRCMGGNSTIIAMAKWPEEFEHINTLVLLMVVSGRIFIEKAAENLRLDPAKAVHFENQKNGPLFCPRGLGSSRPWVSAAQHQSQTGRASRTRASSRPARPTP